MMFDEIDTGGVSGEISNRMGEIMKDMSTHMQVFPLRIYPPKWLQKGINTLRCSRPKNAQGTHTQMKKLNNDERVVELAAMLGGSTISDSAMLMPDNY